MFERFAAEQGSGGRTADELHSVLAALVERRVEALMVREGAEAPGTKCVTCGWLGPAGLEGCPVDETQLDVVENIIEAAIQAAIQQSASVHVVHQGDGDESAAPFSGPMAVLLRY